MSKQPLPPFGPYVMVPLWFRNYCVPRIGPTAACVWELLWGRCRWKQDVYDVKITIRSISTLLAIAPSTTNTAINSLIANKLLAAPVLKSGKLAKTYKVLTYTPEDARLTFKDKPDSLYRKSVKDQLPIFSTRTPISMTENR